MLRPPLLRERRQVRLQQRRAQRRLQVPLQHRARRRSPDQRPPPCRPQAACRLQPHLLLNGDTMKILLVLAVAAIFALLRFRRANLLLWAGAWWVGIYVLLRFGFTAPIPSSVISIYMGIVTVARCGGAKTL